MWGSRAQWMGRSLACTLLLVPLLAGTFFYGSLHSKSLPFDGTIWNNRPISLPAGVEHHTYHSTVMNVEVGYSIYLPPQYVTNLTQRFSVVYWLHGMGGNENSDVDWMVRVLSLGLPPPVIIVFVNGGQNSKYRDAVPGSRMYGIEMVESTIINELVPHVDTTYRTTATKDGRAIQGVSMGGMGALRLAFKHPHLFSSVFGFAPAIDDNASNVMTNEPALMAAMFNNTPSLFDAQNAQTIATNNARNIQGLSIQVVIGSNDSLLPDNQALDALLTSLSISHDPLQIVAGASHDLDALQVAVGYENFRFSATNVP